MCGLGGIASGTLNTSDEDVFKNLLLFNTVRGKDSTGIAAIPRLDDRGEAMTLKWIGPAIDYLDHPEFNKTLRRGWQSVWLGHNRSATQGLISKRNAHPFHFDDIIGMHNGNIDHHSLKKLDHHSEFGTDSEAVIFNIGKHGPEKIIPQLEGAWAFVWYNTKKKTISLIRNERRPLVYVFSEDEKHLYFGSELDLLASALRRNRVRWKDKFNVLPEDTLMTWAIPKQGDKFDKPTRIALEGYKHVWPKAMQNVTSIMRPGNSNGPASEVGPSSSAATAGGLTRPFGVPRLTSQTGTSNSGPSGDKTGTSTPTTSKPKNREPLVDITKDPGYKPDPKGYFAGLVPYINRHVFRIYRHPHNNMWLVAMFNSGMNDWILRWHRTPPHNLPFEQLDINANHVFKHKGKKKKKVIFYRGHGGVLLNRENFEYCMACGCVGCSRRPEWGNKVTFLSAKHDFLCEYCALDKGLVESLNRKKEKEPITVVPSIPVVANEVAETVH